MKNIRLNMDETIEEYLNKLLKTISWSVNNRGASVDDIKGYILSTIESISMKYCPIRNYECSVGDIITVSYCNNPRGEVSGGFVHGIVCDISDDEIIYVIPIAKKEADGIFSRWHIDFRAPEDATYFVDGYEGGVALLEQSRYISRQRIKSESISIQPVGKVSSEFLDKLLELLPKVFSFGKQATVKEDNSKAIDDVAEETSAICSIDEPAINQESSDPKKDYYGRVLHEIIGEALDSIDNSGVVADEVRTFMKRIGMDITDGLLVQSFITSCNIDKITYDNIASDIFNISGDKKQKIEHSLKESFRQWINQYPHIKKKCPKISLTWLLKEFAKRMQ